MLYEPNPKHKAPWQSGRKGNLCPDWSLEQAQRLLEGSVLAPDGKKRYATMNDWAFAAQEHADGKWLGYPVAWYAVPEMIRRSWIGQGFVKRRKVLQNWGELPPAEEGADL